MTRDQLEHAIRAACDVAMDTEVWVFGSQAILGQDSMPDTIHQLHVHGFPRAREFAALPPVES